MASWNPPANSAIDQDKAIKSTDIRAIRDLTEAAMDGESSAPRLKSKTFGTSAAGGSLLTFTGLSDWQGVSLFYTFDNAGGTLRTPTIALSDDGATFGATTNLPDVAANGNGSAFLILDFATGDYSVTYTDGSTSSVETGTIAGGGASVSAFRISSVTDLTVSVVGWAHGGEAP